MRGYYADDGLTFSDRNPQAMQRLLSEPQRGAVLLAAVDEKSMGYVVLCIGFSLELGGNEAFVDELYVDLGYRGQGIAQQLLAALEETARQRNIFALHLEVDIEKAVAHRMYAGQGFSASRDRYRFPTKRLQYSTAATL
jgi:GNAT superfamily N-acetyltransferase